MFRKIAIAVVPVMTLALTTLATDNSAFAKGGNGGHGGHGAARHHSGMRHEHGRDHRHFGSRYGSYGYFGYEAPVCESEIVCDAEVAPVVATACEPVSSTVEYGYAPTWGYGHHRNFRHEGHRGGHGVHQGGGRRR